MPKEEAPATTTPQTGADPGKKPETGTEQAAGAFDTSNIPDDQFERVFEDKRIWEHSRFKELTKQAREGKKLMEQAQKLQEEKMKEEGKFKELLDKREKELEELRSSAQKAAIDGKIQQLLHKEGVVDADAALVLIDRSQITLDKSGNPKGIDKAVQTLKQSKQYLFGSSNVSVGAPVNPIPGNATGNKTFYRSQLANHDFFEANKEDILKASKAGMIIDDISQQKV